MAETRAIKRALTNNEIAALGKAIAMRPSDYNALISSLQTEQTDVGLRAASLQKVQNSKIAIFAANGGVSYLAAKDFVSYNFNSNTIPIGSIAKINISGVIMAKGGWCYEGLEDIEKKINAAGSNPHIKGVILDVDSGGGSVDYLEIFANTVGNFENQYGKPIAVYVPNLAASAAYFIISKAPRIFIGSNLTEIGSIGVMATMYNDTMMLEMEGLKRITVFASQSINKNRPQMEALDGNTDLLQEELSKLEDVFEQTVRAGRAGKINETVSVEITRNGRTARIPEVFTGVVYSGNKIIQMGLADQLGTINDVVSYIDTRAQNLTPKNQEDWNNLSTPKPQIMPLGENNNEEDDDEDDDNYWAKNSLEQKQQNEQMAKEADDKLILALESASQANAQLAKTSGELAAAHGEITKLASKISELEKANANSSDLQSKIEAITAELQTVKAKNADLETLAKEADAYRNRNAELAVQLQDATDKVAVIANEKDAIIANLQKKVNAAERFIAGKPSQDDDESQDDDKDEELEDAAAIIGASKTSPNGGNAKPQVSNLELFRLVENASRASKKKSPNA